MKNLFARSTSIYQRLMFALLAMLASVPAFAGDLADAVTDEITSAKAEVLLVGVAVLGIVGVLILIKSVRRVAH